MNKGGLTDSDIALIILSLLVVNYVLEFVQKALFENFIGNLNILNKARVNFSANLEAVSIRSGFSVLYFVIIEYPLAVKFKEQLFFKRSFSDFVYVFEPLTKIDLESESMLFGRLKKERVISKELYRAQLLKVVDSPSAVYWLLDNKHILYCSGDSTKLRIPVGFGDTLLGRKRKIIRELLGCD